MKTEFLKKYFKKPTLLEAVAIVLMFAVLFNLERIMGFFSSKCVVIDSTEVCVSDNMYLLFSYVKDESFVKAFGIIPILGVKKKKTTTYMYASYSDDSKVMIEKRTDEEEKKTKSLLNKISNNKCVIEDINNVIKCRSLREDKSSVATSFVYFNATKDNIEGIFCKLDGSSFSIDLNQGIDIGLIDFTDENKEFIKSIRQVEEGGSTLH